MNLDRIRRAGTRLLAIAVATFAATLHAQQATTLPKAFSAYYVDCTSTAAASDGSIQRPFRSLTEMNTLPLQPGDSIFLKRGTVCHGALKPHGSGIDGLPIRLTAYGVGDLPRIEAAPSDEEALELRDQEFWEISQLDLKGGTLYGIFIKSDSKLFHHLYLRDLRVHDVRGPLTRKSSGLVIVTAAGDHPTAGLEDVQIDGVMAYRTTQWSGIFVEHATHVRIKNSIVHDVQGDGIVVFLATDAVIEQSVAWHTGMQHQESIGTPNAIWTWTCTDCIVRNNEAFLTDSPGVDGGAFDIDFGNLRNTVQANFGHDTQGYCVSVFGAFGPTVDSVVADNLCLRNGLSPRLAQRQGALLLMTWQGGTLNGVDFHGNRVGWDPPGNTPLVQIGAELKAEHVTFNDNDFESRDSTFVSPQLKYSGKGNHYLTIGNQSTPHERATINSKLLTNDSATAPQPANGWRLDIVTSDDLDEPDDLRATLVAAQSAQLQFGSSGLQVTLTGSPGDLILARDLDLTEGGLVLRQAIGPHPGLRITLTSPSGTLIRVWSKYPGPTDLGYTLWRNLGHPNFSHLGFEDILAQP